MKMKEGEFNFGEGERRRDEGMAQARGRQSNFEFNHGASQFYFSLKVGDVFTPDDVVRHAGLPDEGLNKNNAVGAWINAMAKAGFIKWTGRLVKSERVHRHAGSNKEWIKVK
jgi:hypothetical protein